MKTNAVNWFEIPVTNLERAKGFYEQVTGNELSVQEQFGNKMAWFPMKQDAIGCTGALIQGESYVPSATGSVVYFSVQDLEESLKVAVRNGGEVLVPKTPIGEFGFIAQLKDTEGNRVALHSES